MIFMSWCVLLVKRAAAPESSSRQAGQGKAASEPLLRNKDAEHFPSEKAGKDYSACTTKEYFKKIFLYILQCWL